MSHIKWTDDERNFASDLISKGYIYKEVVEAINLKFDNTRTVNALKHQIGNGNIVVNRLDKPPAIHFVDKQAEVRHFEWREWADEIGNVQKLKDNASWSQQVATVELKSDKPVIIQLIGDTHFGSAGVDYGELMSITDRIVNTENLYVVLLGDVIDNFFTRFRGGGEAVFGMVMTPEEQLYFLDSWLKEIKEKLIAACWGNHDAWYERSGHGFNPVKVIQAKHVPYFNGIGRLVIKVNNIEYKICISHFFKGHSQWNPLHAMIRYSALEGGGTGESTLADIYAQGHHHEPALSQICMHGDYRTYIKCGSIKVDDGYARRYFNHHKTKTDYPSVVLHNEYKKVIPFITGEEALMSVAALNKGEESETKTKK